VEQTAEVGRNGKGGTSPECGISGPKALTRWTVEPLGRKPDRSSSEQRQGREWTPGADADGGANFDNPMRGVLLRRYQNAVYRKVRGIQASKETGRRKKD
jgi:hypothetical protein